VKIYAKGSDTLLPIYEGNGDGFVPAQNPVITANDGRIPTVFWPAALVDVVVEKSNGDGTYTELDSFVAGLDLSSVEAVQGVGSITELRSIMPSENMVVQVNGYYTAGDSPTRKYVWVDDAYNLDDGGYVIGSNHDNVGRWVMLWDDPEFLPASLYGIMCGYSGYAKTSNMASFFTLGHSVTVNSVRVEVPPVLLFDWRMAQPTSGQSSPIAYHYYGNIVTNHYVACARGVVFNTVGQIEIHCAGVRGESFTTAKWMIDQEYTSKDPFEKVTTKMFVGNTQAMHDAFMSCVACSKVKLVEVSKDGNRTTLYDLITTSDDFHGKIVLNYEDDSFPAAIQNVPFYVNIPRGYVRIDDFQVVDSFVLNESAVMKLNGRVCVSSEKYNDGRTIDFSTRTEPTYKEDQVVTICNTSTSQTIGLSGVGASGTGIAIIPTSCAMMFKAVKISGNLRWLIFTGPVS
jgi:hypothetical protein